MFCTDEHRLGLKPVLRSVWAPRGERPVALGHHRFQWLYVTAFVGPATGETVWYLTDTVSKPLFAGLLAAFAREVGAGPHKRVVLLLDNAGWHTLTNLAVPDGLRLVYLPPYSPELQPAETLWTLVDEPVVNTFVATTWTNSSTPSPSGAATSPPANPRSAHAPTSPGGPLIILRANLADVV